MGLALPHLERLALGTGPRQARIGRGLASQGLSPFLDLESATRPTGTTYHFPREVRDLIRKMCRENPYWGAPRIHGELLKLGINIGESSVSKYTVRSRKPPSQTWRTFLENHAQQLVSIDFFTVPTIRFQVLYVFLVLAHDRRRMLHFNVTAHPTAEWTPRSPVQRFTPNDSDAVHDRGSVLQHLPHAGLRPMILKAYFEVVRNRQDFWRDQRFRGQGFFLASTNTALFFWCHHDATRYASSCADVH